MRTVQTTPFHDQRPGTSGLRKKTRVFMQPNYVENFVQAVFDTVREDTPGGFVAETLVVGGDGRYYNRTAIQTIIRVAAANEFGRVLVGRGGILSTPAVSAVIRRRGALGALVLSASHNPGGPDADFGIKYNVRNGGPAPGSITERIYQHTLKTTQYLTLDNLDVDLEREGTLRLEGTEVVIIDPLADYTAVMEELFDFEMLRSFFQDGFRMKFDAMNAVTGPYAHHILEERLRAPAGTVVNGKPLEDFGGQHPDPNLVNASDLVAHMNSRDAPDLGAACDGDGDRNLILGRNFFVTPGDSLALIAEYSQISIPGGNLMDAGMCTICGEESFGTGSNHVREKDGLWAVLCWLSILATTRKSVGDIVGEHWQRFGRSYYQRHDYEGLEVTAATQMVDALRDKLAALKGVSLAGSRVKSADDFNYTDPVDGSVSTRQGIRILLEDGSRILCRLSGTGTEGATLRVYVERYLTDGGVGEISDVLAPLIKAARQLFELRERLGRDEPTIIT